MTAADIRVGDTVRVLDTPYTRGIDPVCQAIGFHGVVVDVTATDADTLGFAAIYRVTVGPFDLALIEADLELVARPARIR